MQQPAKSFRTQIIHNITRVFWFAAFMLLALTILLFYKFGTSNSDAGNAAGFIGIITAVMTLVVSSVAIVLSVITRGSRRLDKSLPSRKVIDI